MTNFSGKPLSPKTGNAACGGPQGGGMDSRRNGVAEISPKYLAEVASNAIPSGYKQTEVGVIPEDWEVVTLGDIGQTVIGLTYSPNDVADFGTLVLRSSNVQNAKLAYADNVYVNMELPERVIVKQGDILICVRNGSRQLIGKCALIDENAEGSAFGAFMSIFRTKYSVFVFYQFQSDLIQNQINEIMGATINQITNKDMSGFKITLPSDEKEQTAIANALSDVDALISELEKLIAKKQAIKTATMQQLLTGRTRLPQFAMREDGTPTNSPGTNLDAGAGGPKGEGQDGLRKSTKPSELGEIPEDWEVVAMGDLGSTYGGLSGKSKQDFGHGNSLYVPFTNVMANVVVDVDNLEKVDVREAQNNLALGDLLFNGSSETPEEVCFSALVSADIRKLYLNSFCFGFRSNQKNAYLPLYLAYWFRSEVGRAAVLVMAQGSTRYNISKSQFMKLTIVLPDTEEQTAIATILSDMDEELQALEQRLSKTRQIKQGMMQELLTGRIRLIKPSKEVIHE